MGLFTRNTSPERAEYKAAKKALANDPVNTGAAGRSVDIDSPEGCANLAAQDRLRTAERNLRNGR